MDSDRYRQHMCAQWTIYIINIKRFILFLASHDVMLDARVEERIGCLLLYLVSFLSCCRHLYCWRWCKDVLILQIILEYPDRNYSLLFVSQHNRLHLSTQKILRSNISKLISRLINENYRVYTRTPLKYFTFIVNRSQLRVEWGSKYYSRARNLVSVQFHIFHFIIAMWISRCTLLCLNGLRMSVFSLSERDKEIL